ncbi:MAG: anhydro-N-acetylmuramic acid kinase [Methylococcales bacterium]|nr:anhydro-N-acetylmuramic acid kinase [Methylococcales bacterium]MDD5753625.1 anhydro-N-acetylmuramic acid kinase [Methylococcales bacterium]
MPYFELYIGLMSGTSIDGIDAALVNLTGNSVELIAFEYLPFSIEIQQKLQQFSTPNALIFLHEYGEMDARLGHLFASAVKQLLRKKNLSANVITAIGSHGQTVYHAPSGRFPFSLQIGDPNFIAEQTGITTVADFRRRDIAAGGQGAPLVPAFHQAVFHCESETRCVVNIGGIANVTVLPANKDDAVIGFDTGTGNVLLNQWIQRNLGKRYDANGAWANTGKVDFELIEYLKKEPYFSAPPPKSTGVDYFSLAWLEAQCDLKKYLPEDVQASLCYLTAVTICEAIAKVAPETARILVCGGGVHNAYLMNLLTENAPCSVQSTADFGLHPDHVEAIAFAWLAKQTIHQKAGNLQAVTGANHPVILGGIYNSGCNSG